MIEMNMPLLLLYLLTWTNPGFVASGGLSDTAAAHELHLSKCEVVYNQTDQALQITMHLFIDDLELALKEKGSDNLFIATEKEHASADSVLYAYLQNEFQLFADNQPLIYSYVGKEPSSDLQAVWCYLEVENFTFPKRLSIRNHVMLDLYDDQKNIVAIKFPGKKGGYFLMEKNSYEETLELK